LAKNYLVTVFAFGFHLVGKCGAQVLQPFAVLTAVEQYLVHMMSSLPAQSELNWLRKSSLVLNVTLFWKMDFRKFRNVLLPVLRSSVHEQKDRVTSE